LIISLIILILLMLLGVTAMNTSDTQFKLTGNLQFEDAAMNNAETAISTAETWLATGTNFSNAAFTTYNGSADTYQLYPIGVLAALTAPDNDPLTMKWADTNSLQVAGNTDQLYIIEQMSTNNTLVGSSVTTGGRASSACNRVNTYRITARGTSARGATKFVESYFSVLSC
jgi:type IV pilus assembly protein PilX